MLMPSQLPEEDALMEAIGRLPMYSEEENEKFGIKINRLWYKGWYADGRQLPVLYEKNSRGGLAEIWMSPTPFELYHMYLDAINVHGDVLVGGLGLGIAALFMDAREDIDSITIVEREPSIVELTRKYMESDRISIVCDTLESHCLSLAEKRAMPYDTAAIDIWTGIQESFLKVHETHELVTPVLREEDGLRVWGQVVFDRMVAYSPLIATKVRLKHNEISTDPCFTCGKMVHIDFEGVCDNCAHFFLTYEDLIADWKWPE